LLVSSGLPSDTRISFFLDALDECPLGIGIAQEWVVKLVQALKPTVSELFLRLSCRTADWSLGFESNLRIELGAEDVAVYQLRHLSREEVFQFATANDVNGEAFIDQIQEAGCAPLASLPVTLQMLLATFRDTGALPSERLSLYRAGLLTLANETNVHRQAVGAVGQLDAVTRFEVAARIAAATTLANRSAIWDGLDADAASPDSMPLTEAVGGTEEVSGRRINVGVAQLREVVRTGLFTNITPTTFSWSHKTFGEYLSAYYLVSKGATIDEKLELVLSGPEHAQGVPPQLREVAGWLASMDQSVFDRIVQTQPELLLASDVSMSLPDSRERLIAELLQKLDEGKIHDELAWHEKYQFLRHPRLSDQLRPYIADSKRNVFVRRVAIDIAEACEARALEDDLFAIAVNLAETPHIRVQATAALVRINAAKERLLSILDTCEAADPEDEIKGLVLPALWPGGIDFERLLSQLMVPKEERLIGAYRLFLHRIVLPVLRPSDALAAIHWLERTQVELDDARGLEAIFVRIIEAVWQSCDEASVLDSFAAFVLNELEPHSRFRYQSSLKEFETRYLDSSSTRRRRFVHALLRGSMQKSKRTRLLIFLPWRIVRREDLPWLVADLAHEDNSDIQPGILELVTGLIDWERSEELYWLWNQGEQIPALQAVLIEIGVVYLDSEFAKWQTRDYLARKQALRDVPKQVAKLDDLLKRAQQAPGEWWRFTSEVLQQEGGRSGEFTGTILHTNYWSTASPETRDAIIAVARRYLREYRLRGEPWNQPHTFSRPSAAGYRAIRLLRTERPAEYATIEPQEWRVWAGAILSLSTNDGSEEREIHSSIAHDAYRNGREQFVEVFTALLSRESDPPTYQLATLVGDWADDSILALLWQHAARLSPKDAGWSSLISILSHRSYPPAIAAARQSLESAIEGGGIDERAMSLIATAFKSTPKVFVDNVLSLTRMAPSIAKDVWRHIADEMRGHPATEFWDLSVQTLAEIYVWIAQHFERAEPFGARWLGPDDHLQDLSDQIVRNLIATGTPDALTALQEIIAKVPDREWLKWSLQEARENARRLGWQARSPRDVLQFVLHVQLPVGTEGVKDKVVYDARRNDLDNNPEITDEIVHRNEPSPTKVSGPRRKLTILFVITEWPSAHGGVPTINRHMASSLAKAGHMVYCFVPTHSAEDAVDASAVGVKLLGSVSIPGLEDSQLLAFGPTDELKPDVVIGHAHVSGPEGLLLARHKYQCKYAHVVHTVPEEIEPYKTDRDGQPRVGRFRSGSQKWERQIETCKSSDLVIAVGPQIHACVATDLSGQRHLRVVELLPGLDPDLMRHAPEVSRLVISRCLFSCRQEDPKLKGTDIVLKVAAGVAKGKVKHSVSFIVRGFRPETRDEEIQNLQNAYGEGCTNVQFMYYSDKKDIVHTDLERASLVLMPSRKEGFGLAGLEAIAAGVPVLITSESGLGQLILRKAQEIGGQLGAIMSDLVIDVTGALDLDVPPWLERVQKVLTDRETAFRNANDVRERLREELSWDAAADLLSAELEAICA
jgi:glycosyltransferase involved in cell wall biosynthesis